MGRHRTWCWPLGSEKQGDQKFRVLGEASWGVFLLGLWLCRISSSRAYALLFPAQENLGTVRGHPRTELTTQALRDTDSFHVR